MLGCLHMLRSCRIDYRVSAGTVLEEEADRAGPCPNRTEDLIDAGTDH